MEGVSRVETYVVRVWLPDRPGALGQVASRVGAVRGDVVGIEILERGGGSAIDELVVELDQSISLDLLVSEIKQVDGVAVEDVRPGRAGRQEVGMAALEAVERLVACDRADRLDRCCAELLDLMEGAWSVALRLGDGLDVPGDEPVQVRMGESPDVAWLSAFLTGSRHLDSSEHANAPGDLAWTHLPGHDLAVAVGRQGRPFHERERRQVELIGRITAALLA